MRGCWTGLLLPLNQFGVADCDVCIGCIGCGTLGWPPPTGIFIFGLNGLPIIGPFIVGALGNEFTGPAGGKLGRFTGAGNVGLPDTCLTIA